MFYELPDIKENNVSIENVQIPKQPDWIRKNP